MNCNKARAALDSAFDHGATPDAALAAHLAACPGCAAHQHSLESLDAAIRKAPPLTDDAALVARIQAGIAAQPPRHTLTWHFPATAAAAFALLTGLGWAVDRLNVTPLIAWQAWLPQEPLLPEWSYLRQEFESIPAAVFADAHFMIRSLSGIWADLSTWTAGTMAAGNPVLWGAFFACLACAGFLNRIEWNSRRTHR